MSDLSVEGRQLKVNAIAWIWIELFIISWLKIRQIQKIDSQTKVPSVLVPFAYKIKHFQKSGARMRVILVYSICKELYLTCVWTIVLLFNGVYWAWDKTDIASSPLNFLPDFLSSDIARNLVFSSICQLFNAIIMFPPTIYWLHDLKNRFDPNSVKTSREERIMEFLKEATLKIILTPVLMLIIIGIVKSSDAIIQSQNWLIILLTSFVYWLAFPHGLELLHLGGNESLIPLFNGKLKTTIESLADGVKFPKDRIFVDISEIKNPNAYYYGFLNYHIIVIHGAIIKSFPGVPKGKGSPPEQVAAIVGHELGHYSHSHTHVPITCIQVMVAITLYTSFWFRGQENTYTAFGFPFIDNSSEEMGEKNPLLPGLVITMQLLLCVRLSIFITKTVMTMITQQNEFQADEFSCDLGYHQELKKGLIKFSMDADVYPDDDPLYSLFRQSHPSIVRRLTNMDFHVVSNNKK